MKFTLSWLKDHLETKVSLKQIVETLTKIGLEVENVDDRSLLHPFCIARILAADKHPNADKLQILSVDTGSKTPVQIVCGAPNARVGLVSVFAPPGTWIPGIKKTLTVVKIRGVKSFGMMCSERELLLSDKDSNILELSGDAPIGTSFSAYAKLDDPIIDIALTPDRADCAGIYGVARDLAAARIGTLRTKRVIPIKGRRECEIKVSLLEEKFLNKKRELVPCYGFSWREIRTLQNGLSPEWLRRRLIAIGHKPINTVVDIANYLTFDCGHPFHVFDADKICGNLVIRLGRDGENFIALDGKNYILSSNHYVIADEKGVVSLPGIIGGKETGCDHSTKNILIESALWNPHFVARTGRTYRISSDARYRFERGVDPNFMLPGLEMATRMIVDLCGGIASKRKLCGFVFQRPRKIFFSFAEVEKFTGVALFAEEICNIFKGLCFELENREEKGVTVIVPSWRCDLDQAADLVKEIMRIHGVDNIVPQPLIGSFEKEGVEVLSTLQTLSRSARYALACRGMLEAMTWSFVSDRIAHLFSEGDLHLRLANPISPEMSSMRPSLLPGLLKAAYRNWRHGFGDLAIFEVSDIYRGLLPEEQFRVAAGIRCKTEKFEGSGRFWSGNASFVTVFDAKADALSVLKRCGIVIEKIQIESRSPPWYHPGRSGNLKLGSENILGYFGEFHPEILETLKLEEPICGFEVFLDTIPKPRKKKTSARMPLVLSPLQDVKRDFSFIIEKDVTAKTIIQAAMSVDKSRIRSVRIFDLFEKIPDLNKKSIGIEVSIQPGERTLTDKELEVIGLKIIENVIKVTKGTLRV